MVHKENLRRLGMDLTEPNSYTTTGSSISEMKVCLAMYEILTSNTCDALTCVSQDHSEVGKVQQHSSTCIFEMSQFVAMTPTGT